MPSVPTVICLIGFGRCSSASIDWTRASRPIANPAGHGIATFTGGDAQFRTTAVVHSTNALSKSVEDVTVTQDFVMVAQALAQPLAVDARAARAAERNPPTQRTGV